MITLEEIELAAARLGVVIRANPAATSEPLSKFLGREVIAKPEHLQRGGSFKVRGAYNFIAELGEGGARAVVAASAGNHAQGVAIAARMRNFSATIFMPVTASLPKIEATRGDGAEVVLEGYSVDECIELARAYGEKTGAHFVPPFDDERIIAGQASIGLELATEAPRALQVLVPIGGGGLIAGIAAALKLSGAKAKVIGVEPAGAAAMRVARLAGHPVVLESTDTMADGVAVRAVSPLTLSYAEAYVDDVVTVEEEEISRAVLALLERAKWLVEPAGALAVAALLSGKVAGEGPVVCVLTGGNIDPLLLTRLVEHGLSAAGRFLMIRVVLADEPGALAALTAVVAELGLNVLSVDHHRSGVTVNVDEVEVFLTVETRDPSHREAIIPTLCARGLRAESLS